MTRQTDTLIQRTVSLALAVTMTAAVLGGINGLAARDARPDALLVQQASASRPV